LLAGFEAWEVEATLQKAIGMFALAVWDRDTHTLLLARDPVGEKPLYYGWVGRAFVFASELKAIRAHPEFRAEVDRDVLALFLRHGYVPAPYSIYRGIRKLPPGTCLRLTAGSREPGIACYWSARTVAEAGAADAGYNEAKDAKAVARHLGTDTNPCS
jgi:asparagine synthase (glutamine-hydrolysing)